METFVEKLPLLLTACSLAQFSGIYAVYTSDMTPTLNSAVNFYLPPYNRCRQYNLTSPKNAVIVSVINTSYSQIDSQYQHRGTATTLENSTVVFTLHFIQYEDEGTYLVSPGGTAKEECWQSYVITVDKDDQDIGYWLNWGHWSACDKTCGPGIRTRIRACSALLCVHGNSEDKIECPENPDCPRNDWTDWSGWSACSVTCGEGTHYRHRYCMEGVVRRVPNERCTGESYQKQPCQMLACSLQSTSTETTTMYYSWTQWNIWSACHQSCGSGVMKRYRQCHDNRTVVEDVRCLGEASQEKSCIGTDCEILSTTFTTPKTTHTEIEKPSNIKADETVTLPLSAVVGMVAGVCILILIVVILILVIKIRRKRNTVGKMMPDLNNGAKTQPVKHYRKKRDSIISQNVSSFHTYAEISDSDVKSDVQRMSVITVDNPYVQLPKSASPRGTGDTNCHQYSNVQETVFVFDVPASQGVGQVWGVSDRNTQRSSNTLDIPRLMSVDSCGYLEPGNAIERAERKKLRYLKK